MALIDSTRWPLSMMRLARRRRRHGFCAVHFAFDRAQRFLEAINPSTVPAFVGGGQLALQALMASRQLGVAHGVSWQLVSVVSCWRPGRSSAVVKLLDLLLQTEAHFAYETDHMFAGAGRLAS